MNDTVASTTFETLINKEIGLYLTILELSTFLYKGFTIVYLRHPGKIPIEINLLEMYDKGIFICVSYNFRVVHELSS